MLQTPPLVKGLPLIGNMVDFMRDKIKLIERGYQQHGEVFAIKLASQNVVVALGPEHSEKIFKLTDDKLSMKEVMQYLVPVVGEVGALGSFEGYMQERKIVAPILGGRHMRGHVEAMVREVQDWLDAQPASGKFDVNEFSQHITMFIAARALLGDKFRDSFGEEFIHLFHELANGVDQFLPHNLPLPKFRRRDKARRELSVLMREMLADRRANPDQYDDFLQRMIEAELDDGSNFSDERVVSLIILMIFAGFDTTSGHLAWALVYLLERPDYLALVQQEVDAVYAEHEQLSVRQLRDLPHLNYAVMEVERYRPAVQVLVRYTKEPIELGGYHIPADWMVMISPEFSHRMERVFTQPDTFDPERFNAERCEHAKHANSLTGFGGGMHKCWGLKFANNEIAVAVAMLLRDYEMTLVDVPVEGAMIAGVIRPKTRIAFRRR